MPTTCDLETNARGSQLGIAGTYAAACAALAAIGLSSFWLKSAGLETVALTTLLLPLAWIEPFASFSFLLFFCNFQNALEIQSGVLFYSGVAFAAVIAFRLRNTLVAEVREYGVSPLLIVAIAFCALEIIRPPGATLRQQTTSAVLTLMVPVTLLLARRLARYGNISWIVMPVVLAGLFGGVASAIFFYGAVPWLFSVRIFDQMRLTGILDGSNAIARLIAPGLIAAALLAARSRSGLWGLCFVILSILLTLTLSKSTIAATVLALGCGIFPPYSRKACAAATATLLATAIVWPATVGPLLQTRAAQAWNVEANTMAWQKRIDAGSAGERLLRAYRLGYSSTGAAQHATSLEDHNLLHTGRRYETWLGGVEVFLAHPLLGVGAGGWAPAMQAAVGTNFSSPHNGFLEALGSYGIAGGLLYIGMVAAVMTSLRRAYSSMTGNRRLIAIGVGIFTAMLLVREIAEPAAILISYPYLFWPWAAFGLIDRSLPRASFK